MSRAVLLSSCLTTLLLWSVSVCAQSITENTQLDFGTLAKPAAGSETFTITTSNTTSGTGTLLFGTSSRGSYQITRGAFSSSPVELDIQNVNTGSAALTLDGFTGSWGGTTINSFPASGLTAPNTGIGTTLLLGATATYTSAITNGTLTPTFDIVLTQP